MMLGIFISTIMLGSIFRIKNSKFLETVIVISVIYIIGIYAYMEQFSSENALWIISVVFGTISAFAGAALGFLLAERFKKR